MLRKYFLMTWKQQGIPLKFFGEDVNFLNFTKWGGGAFSLHFWLAFWQNFDGYKYFMRG